MVATQKAKIEIEETWETVRAKAMVTTDPGEGMAKLGQQIPKIMATLTQSKQGSSPSSAPGSPLEHDYRLGCIGRSTHSCPDSCNGRGGPIPQPTNRVWG